MIKWGQIDFIHSFMNLKIRPLCFHHPLNVDTVFDDVDLFLNQWTVKGYLGPSKTLCKYSQIILVEIKRATRLLAEGAP